MVATGDDLLQVLSALANPLRMKIIATLQKDGRNYISQLAREVGISRPLLHLHLKKLEDAGLVKSQMEVSDDGKAHNYFEVTDFNINISAHSIRAYAASLTHEKK